KPILFSIPHATNFYEFLVNVETEGLVPPSGEPNAQSFKHEIGFSLELLKMLEDGKLFLRVNGQRINLNDESIVLPQQAQIAIESSADSVDLIVEQVLEIIGIAEPLANKIDKYKSELESLQKNPRA